MKKRMRLAMTDKEKKKAALQALSDIGEKMNEAAAEYEKKNDEWWNSLSIEEQEDAFYAVVKRIYQGEIIERGSYRYVLYDVFGFGPEAYMLGMECGYLELHNAIYTHEEMRALRDRELAAAGIDVEVTNVELKK
jgi:hypothetical protein